MYKHDLKKKLLKAVLLVIHLALKIQYRSLLLFSWCESNGLVILLWMNAGQNWESVSLTFYWQLAEPSSYPVWHHMIALVSIPVPLYDDTDTSRTQNQFIFHRNFFLTANDARQYRI